MRDEAVDFQLAPPHLHRINAVEQAIQTFKNHSVEGISSTDKNFSMNQWD